VPFGRKKVIGIVLAQKDKSDFDKLKTIEEILVIL
jgi:primosomal protein N' (replication factor Y)